MRSVFLMFSLLSLLNFLSLPAVIVETQSLEVIAQQLESLDSEALVVFDVDNTLITPTDQLLSPCGKEYLKQFVKSKALSLGPKRIYDLSSVVMLQLKMRLVDERIVSLLEQLKQNRVKAIALTAMEPGKLGFISSREEWRCQQLRDLNIDFDYSYPFLHSITLNGFYGNKRAPLFYQGVLCSGKHPKGKVLAGFLKYIPQKPSKIVFVDDKFEHILSVEEELEALGIPHISFHYTAAKEPQDILNVKRAQFQLEHLIKHQEWLNDSQAQVGLPE